VIFTDKAAFLSRKNIREAPEAAMILQVSARGIIGKRFRDSPAHTKWAITEPPEMVLVLHQLYFHSNLTERRTRREREQKGADSPVPLLGDRFAYFR
jgi:hypothetical protein